MARHQPGHPHSWQGNSILLLLKKSLRLYKLWVILFENLGFLTCKDYLERKDALELFGGAAKNYWNMFSGWADYDRREREKPHPDAWEYFEKFALEYPNEKVLEKTQAP